MRTYAPKPGDIERQWLVIDATDVPLGRLATTAANLLRGKHKPIFAPNADTGDYVIIVNAEKVSLSGKKRTDKMVYRHSGFPGGIYATKFKDMQAKHPGRALEKAVKGMLPKGPLGYAMIKKLKVYGGAEHPHTAQSPKTLEL